MPSKKQDLVTRAAALEAEIVELQQKLGEGEDVEKIVNNHIKLLHRYNETKDATQLLIGKKLAGFRQVTVRELHEDYGLTHAD